MNSWDTLMLGWLLTIIIGWIFVFANIPLISLLCYGASLGFASSAVIIAYHNFRETQKKE